MNKKIILSIILFLITGSWMFTEAQVFKYWVSFNNKTGTPYSVSTPTAYLSPKSIARRTNQGITINQSDLPVNPSYVTQIDAVPTTTVLFRSKWLNGVVVLTNAAAISTINSFSFVASTNQTNKLKISLPIENNAAQANTGMSKMASAATFNYGIAYWQQKMMQVDCLHGMNYRGQGMTIAVIDDGFDSVNTSNLYDSLFYENRLLGTRDFVTGDTMVFEDDTHGAWVLSTMASNKPGVMIGTAPKAKYWLLRSEDVSSETLSEEYNWVHAAEFADSVGADICTTSLIYTQFDGGLNDHTYPDVTGRIAPMSIANNMASRKGMIMLNAAGNEGSSAWYYVCVPADADSIIAVGAVDSLGAHASFSSYGPTYDGRIKPDLSARGASSAVAGPGPFPFYGNGTSFATPIMAGATACLWQYKNFATNMQVITAMKNSATNSSSPNNSIGWGVPQLCNAASLLGGTLVKPLQSESNASIYPNPCSDVLNVEMKNAESVHIKITDLLGKMVLEQNYIASAQSISIKEVSQLNNGIYFISIGNSTSITTIKFTKH